MAVKALDDLDFGSGANLPGQAGGQTVPSFDDTFGTGSSVPAPGDVSIDGAEFGGTSGRRSIDRPKSFVKPFDDATRSLDDASDAVEKLDLEEAAAPPVPQKEEGRDTGTYVGTSNIVEAPVAKEQGINKSKVVVGETKAVFKNPLTGEMEEFDTQEKRSKREKQVNEQIVDEGRQREALDLANDFTESTAKFNLDLADPNTPDPIKTAQLNEMIAKFGPENQAAMDSMVLNLKQQGLDGSGAGNAMMLLMARGNRAQMSEMVGRLNTESAQRITDMNKWGAEFGLRMRSQINNEIQTEFHNQAGLFSLAVEAGDEVAMKEAAFNMGIPNLDTAKFKTLSDFDTAQIIASFAHDLGIPSISGGLIKDATGLDIDTSGLTNPADKAAFEQRASFIESNISNPEAKKAAYAELAAQYPGAFGYGDDSEGAQAFVNSLDFSESGAAAQTQSEADSFWRTESIKDTPNMEGIINAGDRFWESYDEGYIDNAFSNEITKVGSLVTPEGGVSIMDEILDAMSGFGVESIEDIDTREEKEAFMSLSKFKTIQGDVTGTTDQIFDNLMMETAKDPELNKFFTDEKLAGVTRRWILDNIVIGNNFEFDDDGNVMITTDALPPWDERSRQYTFYTWPRATWDAEGNKTEIYSGQEFRDDLGLDSVHNTKEAIAEDQALTAAYENYEGTTEDPLPYREWYDATQGNTKQLEKKFDPTTSDTDFVNDSVAKFDSSLESGDFSDIDDNEWFAILEADASAISKLKDSSGSKSVTDAEINGDEILRVKDFNNLGLRADSEIDGNIQEGNSPDVGVGEGNGSIIVLNGRPARVVEFFSSSKSSFTGGVGARQGNMWVVYLDEDPATREKYNVGGSADFVEV
tara:strand:- start:13885 stop:16482 length:2598 start_codon:yes stop_codon:yes gene_type:complete